MFSLQFIPHAYCPVPVLLMYHNTQSVISVRKKQQNLLTDTFVEKKSCRIPYSRVMGLALCGLWLAKGNHTFTVST